MVETRYRKKLGKYLKEFLNCYTNNAFYRELWEFILKFFFKDICKENELINWMLYEFLHKLYQKDGTLMTFNVYDVVDLFLKIVRKYRLLRKRR